MINKVRQHLNLTFSYNTSIVQSLEFMQCGPRLKSIPIQLKNLGNNWSEPSWPSAKVKAHKGLYACTLISFSNRAHKMMVQSGVGPHPNF